MKTIIKECRIYEDSIIISLEDTRDNYVSKNALGKIGDICISPYGVMINPNLDICEERIEKLREKKLMETFNEIFKDIDYNPISDKYYIQIKNMISTQELAPLGYTIYEIDSEYEEQSSYQINKPKKH